MTPLVQRDGFWWITGDALLYAEAVTPEIERAAWRCRGVVHLAFEWSSWVQGMLVDRVAEVA